MELLLPKHKDIVKIKKVKDEERGIETTYITIKKNTSVGMTELLTMEHGKTTYLHFLQK